MEEFNGTARFKVIRRLGAGGMGVVYEALDRDTNTSVALKTLRRANPESLYRMKQEFRALQDLQHANLVSLGELVEEHGHWFFTMELIPGVDFLRFVRRDDATVEAGTANTMLNALADAPSEEANGGEGDYSCEPTNAFDEQKLRTALRQLAAGVAALHDAEKIHRDIKPSNVRVTPEGRVVLLDFGLVADCTEEDDPSSEQDIVGTAAYMAPEQVRAGQPGPAADWYAVGMVLYQALTGTLPFAGTPLQMLLDKQEREVARPSELVAEIPRDLDKLCAELLARDPADRPTGPDVLRRVGAIKTDGRDSRSYLSSIVAGRVPFVGRSAELCALRRAFDDTLEGRAVSVAVFGDSGVGKSSLLRHFTADLRRDELRTLVLEGRCYEREAVPYRAFDGVIDALSRHLRRLGPEEVSRLIPLNASLLTRVFPILGRVEAIVQAAAPETTPTDPQEIRKRAFSALRNLLGRLADQSRLVLRIDDMQWADADSALLMEDLLHPPNEPALLLIMSSRPEGRASPMLGTSQNDRSRAPRDIRELSLEPLTEAEAVELAERLLDRADIGTGVNASEIAQEAHGHPLYIDELIRHAAAGEASVASLRLEEAISARVARLDKAERDVLQLVALADAPLAQGNVRIAGQMAYPLFARCVAALRVTNLVRTRGARASDTIEPYHDRVRDAVRDDLAPDEAQHWHRRLVAALEVSPEADQRPELLVTHLEAAGRLADASGFAREAARRANEAMAFDQAAALYQEALRLGGEELGDRRDLQQKLGAALANAGRLAEAAPVFRGAAEGADPASRLACQREAAEKWLQSGHMPEGLQAIAEALAEVNERLPATPQRALASLLWRRFRLRVRGLEFRERHTSEIAPHLLTRLDLFIVVGTSLAVVDHIRGADFQTRSLALALRVGERVRVGRALAIEAILLATQGGRSIERAELLAARSQQIASASADPYLKAYSNATTGFLNYFRGRFQRAAEQLDRAESKFREKTTGTAWEQSTGRLFRCFALQHWGKMRALREVVSQSVRDGRRRGDHYLETTLRRRCAIAWLAEDDAAGAAESLGNAPWMPPAGVFHVQHWYEAYGKIEIALYNDEAAGSFDELAPCFTQLTRSMFSRVQMARSEAQWLKARIELAIAETEPTAQLRNDARKQARKLAREQMGFASVWSALTYAGTAACSGDADAAANHLRSVMHLAKAENMPLCKEVARYRLGQLLGGDEGAGMRAQAESWLADEEVKDVSRFVQVFAPGFRSLT